jgi:hypothetical protein
VAFARTEKETGSKMDGKMKTSDGWMMQVDESLL